MKTRLDYYHIFYETAKSASFSEAAARLYVSQSAISQCIEKLEGDLGVRLFLRSRRGITLSKEGAILLERVAPAIESVEQGEALLEKMRHLESGSLTIAAGDSVTTHFLLPYLERFHEAHPDVRIEMANSYSTRLLSQVKEGKADLAFVNLPLEDPELVIEPCFPIHDVFVAAPDLFPAASYTWGELAELPLILLERNSSSRRHLEALFAKEGLTLEPQVELAVHDLLLRFASIRLGAACVVREFSEESLRSGAVRPLPLDPPLPPRHIGYAYRRSTPLSLAAQALLDMVRESCFPLLSSL